MQKSQQYLNDSNEEYLIVEIEDARSFAKELAELVQNYVQLQANDCPLIPYVCMLLDKLRVCFRLKTK